MTVDQRPTAKRLEQSNRQLVRSGIADVHRFDLEKFRFIQNSNFSIQKSEETVLLYVYSNVYSIGIEPFRYIGTPLGAIYFSLFGCTATLAERHHLMTRNNVNV
jgi:hypothetical protein